MRTIALNEWPLSGAWIVSPNVRVWAQAEWLEWEESGRSAIGKADALAEVP